MAHVGDLVVKLLPGKSFIAYLTACEIVGDALEDRPYDEDMLMLRGCLEEMGICIVAQREDR